MGGTLAPRNSHLLSAPPLKYNCPWEIGAYNYSLKFALLWEFYLHIKEVQTIGNKYMQIRICISHNSYDTKKRTFKNLKQLSCLIVFHFLMRHFI